MGTPEQAVPALDAILAGGHDVTLVVTQPDRPVGRRKTPQAPPVKAFAQQRGLHVIQPAKVRTSEFFDAIAASRADAIAVVAYGRILVRPVLDAAVHGAINLHFSLLPAYRGAAPVQWALARGERETGITTFRIDEGLDTGPVLLQRTVAIVPDEHAPALFGRLAVAGAAVLCATLDGLAAGTIRPMPQAHERATAAPILARKDGWWDPAWRAEELAGRVCGFDPWPGVWAMSGGRRIRLSGCRDDKAALVDAVPGTVLAVDGDSVRVACAYGTVARVDTVQPEGGRAMSARDAVSGRLIGPGDRLERPDPAA